MVLRRSSTFESAHWQTQSDSQMLTVGALALLIHADRLGLAPDPVSVPEHPMLIAGDPEDLQHSEVIGGVRVACREHLLLRALRSYELSATAVCADQVLLAVRLLSSTRQPVRLPLLLPHWRWSDQVGLIAVANGGAPLRFAACRGVARVLAGASPGWHPVMEPEDPVLRMRASALGMALLMGSAVRVMRSGGSVGG